MLFGLMIVCRIVAIGPPVRSDMTCLFVNESLNCNIVFISIAQLLMVGSGICTKISIMKQQVETKSATETEELAERIGRQLRGGEVIELISDLGGGKTTFVRGLARGIDSQDNVASPTFTISKVYHGTTLDMHHFDFYRLTEVGIIEHELQEVLDEPKNVAVVEWGKVVEHVLPESRLTIRLTRTGDETRELEFEYSNAVAYLTKSST